VIYADEAAKYAEYSRMSKGEFLEFMVRIAHMRFQSEVGTSPEEKVERTLSMLFKPIGQQLAATQKSAIEISSESDYDSDE